MTLVTVMPATVFASAREDAYHTFSVSEEQIISQLQNMSDEELSMQGFTSSQIAQIRDFDYFAALTKLAALDDETLLLYRYTPDEIKTLRDYVSSGGKLRKTISPNTLTLSLSFKNTVYGKQADGVISWKWKRAAFMKFIDCVAVAWKTTSGSTINYIKNSNNKVTATWTKINPNFAGDNSKITTSEWLVNDNQSIYSHVFVGNSNYFAYTGTGTFTIKSTSGTFQEFYIDYGYGHYTISAGNPTITVGPDGMNVSISFEGGTNDNSHIKRLYNASFGIVQNY